MTVSEYAEYLRLPDLLGLQQPRTPGHADRVVRLSEHFFIVAHQACELWLKQLIADLEATADLLADAYRPDDTEPAADLLLRCAAVLELLHGHLLALTRLPLRDFAEFRPYLGTASGAQSAQFHRIGRLLGDRCPSSVYQSYAGAVARSGGSVAEVCRRGAETGVYHRLAELLLDVGDAYWRWKIAHLALVTRQMDGRPGTGGTSGAIGFLAARTVLPFEELRALRGQVHQEPARSGPGARHG